MSKQNKTTEIKQPKTKNIEESSILMVTGNIINISITFLFLRLISLLFFAYYFGLRWEISKDFKYIPVLSFKSNFEEFSNMNTYSQLFVALFMTLMFLKVSFFQNKKHTIKKRNTLIFSWYLSLWMLIIMYLTSVYINPAVRFQFDQRIGYIIFPVVLLSTIVFLRWDKKDEEENKNRKTSFG